MSHSGIRSVSQGYAIAAPGANTNIITAFTPVYPASTIRVTVALTTSSVFNLRTTDGTTAYTTSFNEGVALVAGAIYTFSFAARSATAAGGATAITYSFQVATDSVIRMLFIEEIAGGVL